ncbi:MAG: class I SAM-dependent rRNA methyltransferase [Ignavibacteria bacterium]|nr:class I SAM-dependent rRNA methyltransferase [Ignavibacteria bacterium]
MTKIRLRKTRNPRIESGYLWIYNNEISSVSNVEPGEIVEVVTKDGVSFGLAFVNPHSLITLRLLKIEKLESLRDTIRQRLVKAHLLRKKIFPDERCYRLVYSESDLLPGLIIDRYGDYFVLQANSAGMEKLTNFLVECLLEIFPSTKGILAKNNTKFRKYEGLDLYEKVLYGDIPSEIIVEENGIHYVVNLLSSPKTGLFLDQKLNKLFIRQISSGSKVLDCFSSFGGFALNSAKGGAEHITLVDISESAIEIARRNFAINHYVNAEFIVSDALDFLRESYKQKKRWDLVVLDPPSFTKSKENVQSALVGYRQINKYGMRVTKSGGFFATASCSMYVDETTFLKLLKDVAYSQKLALNVIYKGTQSPDHPIYLPMPETKYLKFFVFQIV